jgi:hypothetical protein
MSAQLRSNYDATYKEEIRFDEINVAKGKKVEDPEFSALTANP